MRFALVVWVGLNFSLSLLVMLGLPFVKLEKGKNELYSFLPEYITYQRTLGIWKQNSHGDTYQIQFLQYRDGELM